MTVTSNMKEELVSASKERSMPAATPLSYDNIHSAMATVEVATPLVDVTAPATMPEGYKFEAEFNGKRFQVTVPPGGVERGQTFSVSLPNEDECTTVQNSSDPVKGRFRDDLFGFCRYGCCHPSLCLPLMPCGGYLLALAQVMRRLEMTWLADPGTQADSSNTFRIIALIVSVHFILYLIGAGQLALILNVITSFYGLILAIKVRQYLRRRDNIPPSVCCPSCHSCEDCCVSYWCTCCSVSQMMRHTADYDKDQADCCSSTGLMGNAHLRSNCDIQPVTAIV